MIRWVVTFLILFNFLNLKKKINLVYCSKIFKFFGTIYLGNSSEAKNSSVLIKIILNFYVLVIFKFHKSTDSYLAKSSHL